MYTVDYFIRKFEAIPEGKWCTLFLTRGIDRHCALGHCGTTESPTSADYHYTDEGQALVDIFYDHMAIGPLTINDDGGEKYKQPTPKQRILAALYDIKKMQEPEIIKEEPVKPKEYRVVLVEKTIYSENLITTN